MSDADPPQTKSLSVFQRRWRKFKTLRRGWYSLILLVVCYALSLLAPLWINNKALVVKYDGDWYFPVIGQHNQAKDLGQRGIGEAKYRKLKEQYAEADEGNWVLMPIIPYSPTENLLKDPSVKGLGRPPHPPSGAHWLGTDNRGRSVLARLVYGFRTSITFALGVVLISYTIGMAVGAVLGFFGGTVDILGQRVVEIWSGLPFLYTVIIVSAIVRPNIWWLIAILALFGWMRITMYMRGEFYREKSKDYVAAAIAQGDSNRSIMFGQILPNALTPLISFAPFAIVSAISSLVALDYLGFGLQPPTPSWGEMVNQGLQNINKWHLVFFPLAALFGTLLMVVFIGEAIREAFDPKVFSRLR